MSFTIQSIWVALEQSLEIQIPNKFGFKITARPSAQALKSISQATKWESAVAGVKLAGKYRRSPSPRDSIVTHSHPQEVRIISSLQVLQNQKAYLFQQALNDIRGDDCDVAALV